MSNIMSFSLRDVFWRKMNILRLLPKYVDKFISVDERGEINEETCIFERQFDQEQYFNKSKMSIVHGTQERVDSERWMEIQIQIRLELKQ